MPSRAADRPAAANRQPGRALRADFQGPDIRLTVLADIKELVNMPGFVVEGQDKWLRSSPLGDTEADVTADDTTTYLVAHTSVRAWLLAATGPDPDAWLALLRTVAVATIPGN